MEYIVDEVIPDFKNHKTATTTIMNTKKEESERERERARKRKKKLATTDLLKLPRGQRVTEK